VTMRSLVARLLPFSISLALRSQAHKTPRILSEYFTQVPCRKMAYSVEEHGSAYTTNYQLYLKSKDGLVSPFHDIPLFADKENGVYNMVVEIPRWTNAKMEISTKDLMNPIKQDMKKGKVRFVNNVFPHKGYIWNYGALPQTWEDPTIECQHTKQKGDGDPIDVVEIGYKIARRGEVKQVKVLGVMALIDEGETDWKVIAIDVTDPLAGKLNDIDDVRKVMPGLVEATHEWFQIYKMPTGAPPNEFAFKGEAKDRKFTVDIIQETHEQWKDLVMKKKENEKKLSVENVNVDDSPYKISQEKANQATEKAPPLEDPAEIPMEVDTVHYIDRSKIHSNANGDS